MSNRLASSLGRRASSAPLSAGELERLRIEVWREQAIAVIPLRDLYDGEFKERVAEWARRRYGLRTAKG